MSSALIRLAQRITRIENDLAASRTPQLGLSSIDEGSLDVTDPATGNPALQIGQQFDGTFAVTPVIGPTPATPSACILEPMPGALIVRWDGTFADGSVAPMDFARVEVHISTSSSFMPTPETLRGTIDTALGGEVSVVLPAGVLHYVKLVTRSLAGKASGPSIEAAETPTTVGVDQATLDGINANIATAQDAADAAAADANALETLTNGWKAADSVSINGGALYANSIGAGSIATDAILARHVKAGELTAAKLAAGTITAASGVIGSIDAAKITVGKITAAQMATGTITAASGIINDIDASKITAGTMSGARITAGTITADRLSATAIDGKTITGATFKTAASGRRWEMGSAVANMLLGYPNVTGLSAAGSLAIDSSGTSVDTFLNSPLCAGGGATLSLSSPRPGYESNGADAMIAANGSTSIRVSEKYGIQMNVPDQTTNGIFLGGPVSFEYGGFAMNSYTSYIFNVGNRAGGYVGTATCYWWQVGALVYVAGAIGATQATTGGAEVMLPSAAPPPQRRLLSCGTLGVFGSGFPADQSGLSFMSPTLDSLICVSYSNGYRNVAAGNSVRFFCWYDISQY